MPLPRCVPVSPSYAQTTPGNSFADYLRLNPGRSCGSQSRWSEPRSVGCRHRGGACGKLSIIGKGSPGSVCSHGIRRAPIRGPAQGDADARALSQHHSRGRGPPGLPQTIPSACYVMPLYSRDSMSERGQGLWAPEQDAGTLRSGRRILLTLRNLMRREPVAVNRGKSHSPRGICRGQRPHTDPVRIVWGSKPQKTPRGSGARPCREPRHLERGSRRTTGGA